jgi:hypothetical protein
MGHDAHCPKCGEDIGDTYEGADPSVGISAGYYCDACDLGVAEWEVGGREVFDDDVLPGPTREPGEPIGTPFSELASQPGNTPEQRAKYENFKRIAKSWGYD